MLNDLIKNKKIKAQATIGFWPCNSSNDDINLYSDEQWTTHIGSFWTIRQ